MPKTFYVRIDRRRKLPATVLLRALGFQTDELLNFIDVRPFTSVPMLRCTTESPRPQHAPPQKASLEVSDEKGEILVQEPKVYKALSRR